MNKCVKIEIKNCNEIIKKENDYKKTLDYRKILKDLRYQSWLACNKAMTYYYTFDVEKTEYQKLKGININEKDKFGKSHMTWVEDHMKQIMNTHNTGNVSQTNQFVSKRFKDDVKKGVFKGQVSLSNFKQSIPIFLASKNYKISQNNKGLEVKCSLFNNSYMKENDIKQVNFTIESLGASQKSILNKIISGVYKQGAMQISEDRKGKWYLTISFSFEPVTLELNLNKILGIDLGLVNTAVMQVFDMSTEKWDKLSWNESVINGKEISQFRNKLNARKRQIQKASKIVGDGRIGHGKNTKMKPFNDIGDKVARFKDTYNHKVSKYIVEFAVKHNCATIQMENLSGFSEQQSVKFLKNWAYHDLQTKIQYKCEEKGIKFVLIDPKYTSKRCSHCGCIDDANRDCKGSQAKFKCVTCGHEENADINAAKNISIPMIDSIIVEQLKMMSKFKDKKVS